MNQALKITAIGIVALAIAIFSAYLLVPSNAKNIAEYKQLYQQLSQKKHITEREKQSLDALFQKINAKKNVETELMEIIVRNVGLGIVLIPLIGWAARSITLGNNGVLSASALIFLAYILVGLAVFGAIFASTFAIVGLVFKKNKVHDKSMGSEEGI
jgi:hypothetical protein